MTLNAFNLWFSQSKLSPVLLHGWRSAKEGYDPVGRSVLFVSFILITVFLVGTPITLIVFVEDGSAFQVFENVLGTMLLLGIVSVGLCGRMYNSARFFTGCYTELSTYFSHQLGISVHGASLEDLETGAERILKHYGAHLAGVGEEGGVLSSQWRTAEHRYMRFYHLCVKFNLLNDTQSPSRYVPRMRRV